MNDTPAPEEQPSAAPQPEPDTKTVWNFKGPPPQPGQTPKKGRPTTFTRELADKICGRLETGRTLRAVCRDEDMPHEATVRSWATNNAGQTDEDKAAGVEAYAGFFTQYTRAREIGYHCMADELVDIADDGSNDFMIEETAAGRITVKVDHEHIKRSVARIDTRKWLLSKALPKIFGDKLDLNVNGAREVLPNASTDMSIDDARDLYNALRQRKTK